VEKESENITLSKNHRPSIEVTLPDGRVITGPRHAPLETFLKILNDEKSPLIVGAIVDGNLRELTFPISMDARVTPITMADADGARIYRRSLTFLLEVAFTQIFPGAVVTIDHSVSSGGYYCQVTEHEPLTQAELDLLQEHMQLLVEQDHKFVREVVPIEEAINYFQATNQLDKVQLLQYRKRQDLVLYNMEGHRDYHHGYMVPSSGYLKWFDFVKVNGAFILRFPRSHATNVITPMTYYPTLFKKFILYGDWLNHLGISSVGALNDSIAKGRIREVILVSEALHTQQISKIAEEIKDREKQVKVILIAGPSSSGKTTFSKRLSIQLLTMGLSPFALELDHYFVDRHKTPKGEDGNYDFESIDALDRARLNSDIKELIAGKEVQLPRYDFISGLSVPGEKVHLQANEMIILEGIHGLNPLLLEDFDASKTYKIYVSCLTQLNLDRHNRISTTDTRMLRRIVRDARDRGYSAQDTISRWESVRRGEKVHIFTFQENADVMFNTALAYELTTLKPLVEPLLRQVPFGNLEYIEAKRLLKFLEWFLPTDEEFIPDNSILREFVGNSSLKEFTIWHQ
jgi:uridine kinase